MIQKQYLIFKSIGLYSKILQEDRNVAGISAIGGKLSVDK